MTVGSIEKPHGNLSQTTPQQVRDALTRVLNSKEFVGSERMRAFLTYVVTETLEHRQDAIRAKTIAMDVYDYGADELAAREGVVRVDAGRVRRKLQAYYENEGAGDTIRISLPVGSYAPVFLSEAPPSNHTPRTAIVAAGMAAAALAIAAGPFAYTRSQTASPALPTEAAKFYDVSPARTEAINLGEAGRDLIFPSVDVSRLQSAYLIFQAAMERDPHYFGGYAGAAQVETMRAIILSDNKPMTIADEFSAQALDMAPDDPWALSARAWFEFASQNYDTARSLSQRAAVLAPQDPHIAEFDALISLYTNDYDRVLQQADQYHSFSERSRSTVFGNALGAAHFHTGNYGASIEAFDTSIASGGPFGPITSAYVMAAQWRDGNKAEARRLADLFMKSWPEFPLEAIKRRVFATSEPVDDLVGAMRAAGWSG